ncbi:(2Fe-2S)-binding protein [Salipaludibacillus sp. HK11]|uniref:(2Fe-2S)-binding protein n=1 Tax=Salipaludibacillus sp. HK11 TaxID=3394320 RepID=UPI0039FCC718
MPHINEIVSEEQRKIFGIRSGEMNQHSQYSLHTSSFRTRNGVESYCNWYAIAVDAPSFDVVGTFWASRLGRYVAFVHWCISRGITLEQDWDIDILYLKNEASREPSIHYVVKMVAFHPEDNGDKNVQLHDFYQNYLSPMIHTVANVCEIKSSMLWGQLVQSIPYFLKEVSKFESEVMAETITSSWEYMKETAPAHVFLEEKNPFPYRSLEIANPKNAAVPMQTKAACCLYFKLSGNYCYSCPRLTPAKRQEKYDVLIKKQ